MLGMDSHSVDVQLPANSEGKNKQRRIDVPMRSFQGGYYPQLIALYTHLGVNFREADFTYSFAQIDSNAPSLRTADASKRKITTFMIYDGASGQKGISVPSSYFPTGTLTLWDTMVGYMAYAFSAFVLVLFSLRMAFHSLPIRSTDSSSKPPSHTVSFRTTFWGLSSTPVTIRLPRYLLPVIVRPAPNVTFREWIQSTTPRSTLSRWLGLDKRWMAFAEDILIPLFSAVCTASEEAIWEHPVEEFLDFAYLTIGTHHYVVQNGVRDVVDRISSPLKKDNIHLSSPIVSLVYTSPSSSSHSSPKIDIHCTNHTVYSGFDHIIFATQANQAMSILNTYIDSIPLGTRHRERVGEQIECLRGFGYVKNVVVNHTDSTVMPDSRRDRRDLNLMMARAQFRRCNQSQSQSGECGQQQQCGEGDGDLNVVPPTFAMATHMLTGSEGVYQTTNPVVHIEEEGVLSVARLERAVVTVKSKAALKELWVEDSVVDKQEEEEGGGLSWGCAAVARGRLGRLQGAGVREEEGEEDAPGIWLCGSYAYGGIPLLEGCVVSARLVVEEGVWAVEGVSGREKGQMRV
ncbi:hypothetical protein BDY19DRAFT_940569 [Irpex rosettiformis]|uniref:Uncharacterized protein n=1 Tax=Irpex rosettiformis TaxID=378272 RepID=A0ACB8U5Z8_9APHY|nr:hypothetical protein BDY19DRAFT_940569 [Irpex rosettiformis]